MSHVGNPVMVFGTRWTASGIWIVFGNLAVIGLIWLWLSRTKTGLALRAIACDTLAARIAGAGVRRRLRTAAFAAGSVAGLAGILVALDSNVQPAMGLKAALFGCVAIMVTRSRSIGGAALACFVLGFLQHASTIILPVRWQDMVVYSVLVVALVLRNRQPIGIAGTSF